MKNIVLFYETVRVNKDDLKVRHRGPPYQTSTTDEGDDPSNSGTLVDHSRQAHVLPLNDVIELDLALHCVEELKLTCVRFDVNVPNVEHIQILGELEVERLVSSIRNPWLAMCAMCRVSNHDRWLMCFQDMLHKIRGHSSCDGALALLKG